MTVMLKKVSSYTKTIARLDINVMEVASATLMSF